MTPALREVVGRLVGAVSRWTEHTQEHGLTPVFRADDVWVKAHPTARKYAQELTAYREVVPGLHAAGFRVPTLLASDDDARVLVISHVSGVSAEHVPDRRDLHRQAGELLAVLHALPCERPDPLSLRGALVLRLDRWIERARPHLPADLLERARARFGDGRRFDGARRVWCHRDFSARNWLVDDGRLGLIDFEHTRPDLWHVDLERLTNGDWADDPGTRAAFFEGHPPLSADDVERLELVLWLTGVTTVAWSEEHGDAGVAAHGRKVLAQLDASRASRIACAEG